MPKRAAQNGRRANRVCGTSAGETGVNPACSVDAAGTAPRDTTHLRLINLWHARRAMAATEEQRQYPRLGLGVPVTLQFLGRAAVNAELQDISRGGCFFKSPEPVSLD